MSTDERGHKTADELAEEEFARELAAEEAAEQDDAPKPLASDDPDRALTKDEQATRDHIAGHGYTFVEEFPADGGVPEDGTTTQVGEHKPSRLDEQAEAAFGGELPPSMAPRTADEAALRDIFPMDVKGHAAYPVEQARAYAADDLVPTQAYNTPWGVRAMGDVEVNDLRRQGLTIEPVDSAPTESLEQDKAGMSHVEFGTRDR